MSNAQFAILPDGFDPRRIDPEGLREFRKWITERILPAAGKYGEYMHGWCQAEEVRQRETPEHALTSHVMGVPDLRKWSLFEVAQAAYIANEISKTVTCEMLGRLFDHQVAAFTFYLATKLEEAAK